MKAGSPIKKIESSQVSYDSLRPDVAIQAKAKVQGKLDKVGMEDVELAVTILDQYKKQILIPATANLYVDLDNPTSKGIHMSRLFLIAQEHLENNSIDHQCLLDLVQKMKKSHQDISTRAEIQISFDYMIKRPALKSEYSGWRTYPVTLKAILDENNVFGLETSLRIAYSSTCPCSAALSRQLLQDALRDQFAANTDTVNLNDILEWLNKEENQVASPHSQRSYADISLNLQNSDKSLVELIDIFETAIATPVQAAVKRADEQEFARLNGSNLMFSEDAARRMKNACEELSPISYSVKVSHIESLHPHDAVAYASSK